MNVQKTLRALGAVVLDEVGRNPDFAQRLVTALGATSSPLAVKRHGEPQVGKRPSRARAAAIVDPMAVLADQGEEALRSELTLLPLDKLLDVVAEFAMDPSKLVMKWKSSDRVREHIIDSAKRRSIKGNAFRS